MKTMNQVLAISLVIAAMATMAIVSVGIQPVQAKPQFCYGDTSDPHCFGTHKMCAINADLQNAGRCYKQ